MPLEGYQFTCDNCGHKKLEKRYPNKILIEIKARIEGSGDCFPAKGTELTICQDCKPSQICINKHLMIKYSGYFNEKHVLTTFLSEVKTEN